MEASVLARLGERPWSKNGRHILDARGRLVAEASDPFLALGIVEAVNEVTLSPEDTPVEVAEPKKRKWKAVER